MSQNSLTDLGSPSALLAVSSLTHLIKKNDEDAKDNQNLRELKTTGYKWVFLFFTSTMITGVFYVQNMLAVLRLELKADFHLEPTQLNWIFAYPKLPNIVLSVVNGLLFDNIGFRNGGAIFTLCVVAGTVLQYIGVNIENFYIFIVGVFFNDISLENIAICQNSLISKWFIGDLLTFALSIKLVYIRLSQIASSSASAPLYNTLDNFQNPYIVCISMAVFSFAVSAAGTYILDVKQDRSLHLKTIAAPGYDAAEAAAAKKAHKNVSITDIRYLPLLYWLLNATIVFGAIAFFPFMYIAESVMEKHFKLSNVQAGQVIAMPYFFALVSPIVGILADKFGKRSLIMMGCFLLLILTYVIFLLIPQCEEACLGLAIFPMSLLGVYFGVYTSIVFASVPLVAPRQYLATAFGLVSSCRAIGFTVIPVIVESFYDAQNPGWTFFFFLMLACVSFALSYLIFIVDKRKDKVLLKVSKRVHHHGGGDQEVQPKPATEGKNNDNQNTIDARILLNNTDELSYLDDSNKNKIFVYDNDSNRESSKTESSYSNRTVSSYSVTSPQNK